MVLRYLIEKEFKQMMRNIVLPVVFVIFPIALMNVIPRIATQEVKNLKFSVVDNDHSGFSERLIAKIDASNNFELVGIYPTYEAAMATIESCEADVVLEIAPDFERKLVVDGRADVSISGNAVNGMKGSLGANYVAQIVADFSSVLRDEAGLDGMTTRVKGFDVRPRFLYNTALDYKLYMIPALLGLLLIIMVGFLPALNIVGEKEKGTIEQINVTPVSRIEFILSKLIPYLIVGLVLLTFAMLLARAFHGFVPKGNVGFIYLFSVVFCLVVASFGLIISNYSSTTQQAALTFFFFMMIFMLMSGLLTPVNSMPQWAKYITYLNPMRYFMEAMRTLYMKPAPLSALRFQLIALLAMAVVMWTWAIVSYKKKS